ncbi:ABC transporter substrate-binding protein [Parapusillimonas sp. SGNA-6]|nr:ABC transporter substrate-binding protein [Parapusillimonas sp. SGNA-6]
MHNVSKAPTVVAAGRRKFLTMAAATGAITALPIKASWAKSSKVSIGIGADWGTSGHAVIALHKGFLKAEGLNAELKYFPAGALQAEALAAGAIDVSNPTQAPIISLRAAGFPVVVLSSLTEYRDSHVLLTRADKKVREPQQLEGLKIGLLKGSSIELMMDTLFEHYGVTGSKVEMVNLAPPQAVAGLATGAVDGICVWQPWVHQAMQKIPSEIVHTGAHSRFKSNEGQAVRVDFTRAILTTSEMFVKRNPEVVDALMRAYARAQAFVSDERNFEEMVSIFSDHHKQDPQVNKVILKDPLSTLALDASYVEDINRLQRFLLRTGRIKKEVDLGKLTITGPLSKIDPKWVSIL